MQAGASLTFGTCLLSMLYPVKAGIVGYVLVLWSLFKSEQVILPTGIVFFPIFVIATDCLSLLGQRRRLLESERRHAQAPAAPTRSSTTAKTDTSRKAQQRPTSAKTK